MVKEMAIDLAELGLTPEKLQDRVVDALVNRLLDSKAYDDEGNEFMSSTGLHRAIEKRMREHLEIKIGELFTAHVAPVVSNLVENFTLQETNRWGEKAREPITFTEYLVQRADAYIREEVNYEGKSKDQANGYSWNKSGTRVGYLVNQHLHWFIEEAMRKALANANSSIVKGLEEATKIGLQSALAGLKVEVKTK